MVRAVALASAIAMGGCYRYVPAEMGAVPPGQGVRLYVTRQALDGLSEIPVQESPILTGTLIRAEPASLLVRLPVAARQQGFSTQVLGQDVFIARDQVIQIERRELNRMTTGLATVGGTALITGVAVLIMSAARQGELLPGSTDVELAPRFSIPFP